MSDSDRNAKKKLAETADIFGKWQMHEDNSRLRGIITPVTKHHSVIQKHHADGWIVQSSVLSEVGSLHLRLHKKAVLVYLAPAEAALMMG